MPLKTAAAAPRSGWARAAFKLLRPGPVLSAGEVGHNEGKMKNDSNVGDRIFGALCLDCFRKFLTIELSFAHPFVHR